MWWAHFQCSHSKFFILTSTNINLKLTLSICIHFGLIRITVENWFSFLFIEGKCSKWFFHQIMQFSIGIVIKFAQFYTVFDCGKKTFPTYINSFLNVEIYHGLIYDNILINIGNIECKFSLFRKYISLL